MTKTEFDGAVSPKLARILGRALDAAYTAQRAAEKKARLARFASNRTRVKKPKSAPVEKKEKKGRKAQAQ